MNTLKYHICLLMFIFLTTLILLGCETERYTTKFELTPTMEDSKTTPERLTNELDDELRLEDEKRMKKLQEKAEKERKPETSKESK